jgi:hypothetical protein
VGTILYKLATTVLVCFLPIIGMHGTRPARHGAQRISVEKTPQPGPQTCAVVMPKAETLIT